MSFEPDGLQRLLLWRLAVGEDGGEFLKRVESKITPARRQPLIREGLVEEKKRKAPDSKSPITYLELTEKGWAWCQNHLGEEFNSRSYLSRPILERLLRLMGRFFEHQDATVSFGQFVQQAQAKKSAPAAPISKDDGRSRSLEQIIRQTCKDLADGRENVRVRLSDLRARLPHVDKAILDQKLLEMESNGAISLVGLDNPQEIRFEDKQAVLRTPTGSERHLVYYGGRAS